MEKTNKNNKLKLYAELFVSFFKIALFTFGGGYAMLPLINKEVVEKKQWATDDEIINYFAISQCTPGVIAVNTATFIGYKIAGVMGGIIATIGVVTPSIIIIVSIANVLNLFMDNHYVSSAFAGIRVVVTALIASVVIKLFKTNVNGIIKVLITIASFISIFFFNVSPIYITIISCVIGIVFLRGADNNA